jgi:hypothetical protein
MKLEALTKIMAIQQGNKYVHSVLISILLAIKNEQFNWVV